MTPMVPPASKPKETLKDRVERLTRELRFCGEMLLFVPHEIQNAMQRIMGGDSLTRAIVRNNVAHGVAQAVEELLALEEKPNSKAVRSRMEEVLDYEMEPVFSVLEIASRAASFISAFLKTALALQDPFFKEECECSAQLLLSHAEEIYGGYANLTGVRVNFKSEATQNVTVAPGRIIFALATLLGNAIKAAAQSESGSGEVWLIATDVEGEPNVKVSIVDNGPGLLQDWDGIIQSAGQPDFHRQRGPGGRGQGLPLAAHIVGPTLRLVNNESGPGANASFLLPAA